jgi:hypothetical protein
MVRYALAALGRLGGSASSAYAAHEALCREGLELAARLGARRAVAECLEAFGVLCVARDQVGRAMRAFAAAEVHRDAMGAPVPPAQLDALHETQSTLRKLLKPAKYAAARKRGRQMALDEAVQLALETR